MVEHSFINEITCGLTSPHHNRTTHRGTSQSLNVAPHELIAIDSLRYFLEHTHQLIRCDF